MVFSPTVNNSGSSAGGLKGLYYKLNHQWHEKALLGFIVIVLGHWAEHLTQAFQIYVLHWARPDSRGVLGQFFPWLIKSESLHYGYALVMLVGIFMLRDGFKGRSGIWWSICLCIQFWHHFEHALLQTQAILGHNFFGSPVPTSILQLVFPRVELHLFYNTVVFIPMVIAMYYHKFPPTSDDVSEQCTCARKLHPITA
ncbi:hypothetical protein IAD21_03469 [Abditibacteriota bacterium]|nr:hypothetical protein IAD21_03469 [Abditibacteriota bacterium]